MQGTVLGSRYRVIEYIAKGGFGRTYLAEDTQLPDNGRCVVKQLYPSVEDPNFTQVARRLFKTEADTLNTLGSHDRIPQLLAYFEEDEKFYLVQQYIEGHTLSQELIAGKPWSESKVVELLQDCLNILSFIHGRGVIHRDVKPDNLIRRQSDNKLVLVDFGTVKEVIAKQTQFIPATVAVGTRGYMPTEQARGKPRTTSDIYALGVIAIQALTGIHPTQLAENDEGEIVWQEQANCSPQLKAIIARMTRYHFKERQQKASEIAAALTNLGDRTIPKAAKPAIEYTPTVQLDEKELANLAGTPQPDPSTVRDPDLVAVPEPQAGFSSASTGEFGSAQSAGTAEHALHHHNESDSMSNNQKSGKTIATLGLALAVGAIATGGMYLLNQRSSQTAQENATEQVDGLNQMVASQDYQGCYDRVVALKTASTEQEAAIPLEQQPELEAQCGLELAKQEAGDLKYSEALAIAASLPKQTALDEQIQQETDKWSAQLLEQATKLYQKEGKLEDAIALVNQIPQDSSIRTQVIDAKAEWKTETKQNETAIEAAEKALSEEKWRYAKQQARKVQDSPSMYWQERAKTIISQADEALDEIAQETPETKVETSKIETEAEAETPTVESVEPVEPDTPTQVKPLEPKPEPAVPIVPEKTVKVEPAPETERVIQDTESIRDLDNADSAVPETPGITIPEPTEPTEQGEMPLRDLWLLGNLELRWNT